MVQQLCPGTKTLNGKVRFYLDPARLNQVLIRLVHREPTLNAVFSKVNNAQYLSPIDASSGYHNLKLDERLSHLTTLACQFSRFRYKRLPFGVAPARDMFKRKTDEIFKNFPNVSGITDDILVKSYDSDCKDHDYT